MYTFCFFNAPGVYKNKHPVYLQEGQDNVPFNIQLGAHFFVCFLIMRCADAIIVHVQTKSKHFREQLFRLCQETLTIN